MKLLKLTFGLLSLLIVTSCVTTLPLNQQFTQHKERIILQVDSIEWQKLADKDY
jgi:hypothetical protein